jgi:hypothetical protein
MPVGAFAIPGGALRRRVPGSGRWLVMVSGGSSGRDVERTGYFVCVASGVPHREHPRSRGVARLLRTSGSHSARHWTRDPVRSVLGDHRGVSARRAQVDEAGLLSLVVFLPPDQLEGGAGDVDRPPREVCRRRARAVRGARESVRDEKNPLVVLGHRTTCSPDCTRARAAPEQGPESWRPDVLPGRVGLWHAARIGYRPCTRSGLGPVFPAVIRRFTARGVAASNGGSPGWASTRSAATAAATAACASRGRALRLHADVAACVGEPRGAQK